MEPLPQIQPLKGHVNHSQKQISEQIASAPLSEQMEPLLQRLHVDTASADSFDKASAERASDTASADSC